MDPDWLYMLVVGGSGGVDIDMKIVEVVKSNMVLELRSQNLWQAVCEAFSSPVDTFTGFSSRDDVRNEVCDRRPNP